jgi:uncharacterized protein GlcG (DUF336 family)
MKWEVGVKRIILAVAVALAVALPASAADGIITYQSLSPDVAFDLARATLLQCRKDGFQVAVVVADRFGQTLVLLRDRFAGNITEAVATRKALTSLNFARNSSEVAKMFKSGELGPEYNRLPNILPLSGGLVIQAGGSTLGAVGVSGGPPGDADENCAKAGLAAVRDKLDF